MTIKKAVFDKNIYIHYIGRSRKRGEVFRGLELPFVRKFG
jgi:hypothetical protein